MRANYHVVYLTGAPASGKTTLTDALSSNTDAIRVFSYSKELLRYIERHYNAEVHSQDALRRASATLIGREDVSAVDQQLINFVQIERVQSHVVIDSHAVTKERYGYRVLPFSMEKLRILAPTVFIVLYTDSQTVIDRIKANAQGRPVITPYEADFHTQLQASVALTYALELAVPIHFMDSRVSTDVLASEVRRILNLGQSQ